MHYQLYILRGQIGTETGGFADGQRAGTLTLMVRDVNALPISRAFRAFCASRAARFRM